ncbi:hypothetical protein E2C01_033419 [Portunus trituberculatus]|uniref:Uncharacterized protein n=1 Tax=Portunus trituberculatus TaxID=210409 RepID=A0A5B7F3P4_PORTR|nr:hypothetical protein [Portunus trituberculatus]
MGVNVEFLGLVEFLRWSGVGNWYGEGNEMRTEALQITNDSLLLRHHHPQPLHLPAATQAMNNNNDNELTVT